MEPLAVPHAQKNKKAPQSVRRTGELDGYPGREVQEGISAGHQKSLEGQLPNV